MQEGGLILKNYLVDPTNSRNLIEDYLQEHVT